MTGRRPRKPPTSRRKAPSTRKPVRRRKARLEHYRLHAALLLLIVLLVAALVIGVSRGGDKSEVQLSYAPTVKSGPANDVVFEAFHTEQPEQEVAPAINTNHPAEGIVLIIDDVGYDMVALDRLLALPFTTAIAVLPDSPHALDAASAAHGAGRMVMLHLPMEPETPKYRQKMGPWFVRGDMNEAEVRTLFERALERVPFAVGMNNHMGSFLTEQADSMRWIMNYCRERGLFFIDSKTSSKSVAADIAREAGIAWASRQLFLDHHPEPEALQKAWNSALKCQQKHRVCIVIGHPYPTTLDFLEHGIKEADRSKIVPLSIALHQPSAVAHNAAEVPVGGGMQ